MHKIITNENRNPFKLSWINCVCVQHAFSQLKRFSDKYFFFPADARSCNDVRDVVDKLKIRAVTKIREFLLEKVNSFKKPMTNYHIPQNTILKFKFYYKFLMANNREVAKEIKDQVNKLDHSQRR